YAAGLVRADRQCRALPETGSDRSMTSRRSSVLYLQMGQEVIYFILTASVLINVLLASMLLHVSPSVSVKKPDPVEALDSQPPIITLGETEGYFFALGSAELPPDFKARLSSEVVPKLLLLADIYDADVVEVIGHTDGIPIGPNIQRHADLDMSL